MASDETMQAILKELREIKTLLAGTTNDGMPLQAMVPSTEVLASLIASAALISRDRLAMTQEELQQRAVIAQVLASELIRQHDVYQAAKREEGLASLLRNLQS